MGCCGCSGKNLSIQAAVAGGWWHWCNFDLAHAASQQQHAVGMQGHLDQVIQPQPPCISSTSSGEKLCWISPASHNGQLEAGYSVLAAVCAVCLQAPHTARPSTTPASQLCHTHAHAVRCHAVVYPLTRAACSILQYVLSGIADFVRFCAYTASGLWDAVARHANVGTSLLSGRGVIVAGQGGGGVGFSRTSFCVVSLSGLKHLQARVARIDLQGG